MAFLRTDSTPPSHSAEDLLAPGVGRVAPDPDPKRREHVPAEHPP
jgi:hypothetical protein